MYLRKAWIWLCAVLLICLLPLTGFADRELRGYVKGNGWQYVHFGEYPYERNGKTAPVLWRILDITDGKALLMTEYIIDTQQVIFEKDQRKIDRYDYRRINHYSESDLYTWMNTEALDTLLAEDPMRAALVDEPGGGKLFILTMEQFLNPDYGFAPNKWDNQPTRHAKGTPYAAKRGLYIDNDYGNGCYWAADIKDPEAYRLALVGFNGHLSWGGYTRTNVGLRMSVRLDLSQLEVYEGSGTKKDPFVLTMEGEEPYHRPTPTPEPTKTPRPTRTPRPTKTPRPTATPKPTKVPKVTAVPTATPVPTPTPTPRPTRVPGSKDEVLLSFIGDCSIGDSEQFATYDSSYHTAVDEKGYAWPFSLVQDVIAADDLTIANLEAVLTTKLAHTTKTYNLVADPDHVNILLQGSVEMVNTANNHAMDFHRAGYQDMMDCLDEAGIGHFGSLYPSQENGFDDLAVKEINGIRIGFMGFSYPQESDKKRIANRVKILKEEQGCDLVVVSLHWGTESQQTPDSGQVVYAKAAIDAGADVIYGHHAHVIQPVHFYKGKPIFYSTGNFTFGTMSRVDPAAAIFQLAYERVGDEVQLVRFEAIPCETQYTPDFRPFILEDENARREVFKKLRMKRNYAKCTDLPESFLETGVVYFENGEMLP